MVSFGLLRYLTQNHTISTSALTIFPDFTPPLSPSSGNPNAMFSVCIQFHECQLF
jgi:hypothetical protein